MAITLIICGIYLIGSLCALFKWISIISPIMGDVVTWGSFAIVLIGALASWLGLLFGCITAYLLDKSSAPK